MILKNAKAFLVLVFCSVSACCNNALSQGVLINSSHTTICMLYENHRNWLPECYLANAQCACTYLPNDSMAQIVRSFLIFSLDTANMEFKTLAKRMKSEYVSGTLSKKKYHRFVKKYIVPRIYSDHVNAYRKAGCKTGPAPYWEWKVACTREFRNCKKMLRYNLKFGGGCNKKYGNW